MRRSLNRLRHTAPALAPLFGALALIALIIASAARTTEAHKGITSKYNYNEHVFPILRERCGGCHYAGGPAPMSLVDYIQAVPWAESIREALIGQKMPPWYADPMGPAIKGGHVLPTRELDILLSWVVGGTPRQDEKTFVFGDVQGVESPTYEGPAHEWPAGAPDLKVQMPAEHSLPAGKIDDEQTFTLPTGLTAETWVKAIDLLPGERSMVRDAIISLENGPVLGAWVPGHEAIATPNGVAFRLPAGAKLTLKIHYKKNWNDEQNVKSDRSTVGLYFTEPPLSGRTIEAVSIAFPNGESDPAGTRTFSGTMKTAGRVVGLRPSFDQAYASATLDAVAPNGRRITLLRLRAPQPLWYRRYWLQEPIELPAGSKLEMTAVPAPPDEFGIPVAKRYPLAVDVDYVAQ
jgi:hypothetical protein